jgi:hypothetical protein
VKRGRSRAMPAPPRRAGWPSTGLARRSARCRGRRCCRWSRASGIANHLDRHPTRRPSPFPPLERRRDPIAGSVAARNASVQVHLHDLARQGEPAGGITLKRAPRVGGDLIPAAGSVETRPRSARSRGPIEAVGDDLEIGPDWRPRAPAPAGALHQGMTNDRRAGSATLCTGESPGCRVRGRGRCKVRVPMQRDGIRPPRPPAPSATSPAHAGAAHVYALRGSRGRDVDDPPAERPRRAVQGHRRGGGPTDRSGTIRQRRSHAGVRVGGRPDLQRGLPNSAPGRGRSRRPPIDEAEPRRLRIDGGHAGAGDGRSPAQRRSAVRRAAPSVLVAGRCSRRRRGVPSVGSAVAERAPAAALARPRSPERARRGSRWRP